MPPSCCYGAGQLGRGALWGSLCGKIRKIRTFPLGDFIELASGRLRERSLAGSQAAVVSQFVQLGCLSALPRRWGIPPQGRSVPQYARAGRTCRAILPPGKCVERMPLADLLREMHRPLWERIAGVFYSETEHQRTPSSCGISIASGRRGKHPSPPCDGKVRRCENCGDTGGSVEAFVEAWPILSLLG
jgi:hypothetical protein